MNCNLQFVNCVDVFITSELEGLLLTLKIEEEEFGLSIVLAGTRSLFATMVIVG